MGIFEKGARFVKQGLHKLRGKKTAEPSGEAESSEVSKSPIPKNISDTRERVEDAKVLEPAGDLEPSSLTPYRDRELGIEHGPLFRALEVRYDEMVETLPEVGFKGESPSKEVVMDAIRNLSPEILWEISRFGKPTILITPNNSFLQTKAAMDAHPHYPKQKGGTTLAEKSNPFTSVVPPPKCTVSIVDGAAHMSHIPGIPSDLPYYKRRDAFKAHYAKKKMKLINIYEYQVLMQKSLRDYEKNGNNTSEIVDFDSLVATHTCLSDEYFIDSTKIVSGGFNLDYQPNVQFSVDNHDCDSPSLRGRPSFQLMEF